MSLESESASLAAVTGTLVGGLVTYAAANVRTGAAVAVRPCERTTVPLQNRVTPLGELIADPARGLVYGNRGCLHDERGRIRRRYQVKRWIACRLEFRGWHRSPLMQPGRFTELFFLDEATALAAGHRPCALCRRADYERLTAIWADIHSGHEGADAIDTQLHGERLGPRRTAPLDSLPDCTFVLDRGEPWLVLDSQLLRWEPAGYAARRPRPRHTQVEVITPPSLVSLLERNWDPLVPLLHPSARSRPGPT